jgi:hypothetical protein
MGEVTLNEAIALLSSDKQRDRVEALTGMAGSFID